MLPLFTAPGSFAYPLVNTVVIDGKIYTSPDATRQYDFIMPSNDSWDTGIDHVNVVDFILNGRLNPVKHTYTLLNSPASTLNEMWLGVGFQSFIIDEIAGYSDTNTFGYYTESASNAITRHNIFKGLDDQNTKPASFTFASEQNFGFYIGVPTTSKNTYYYTENSLNFNHATTQAAIFRVDKSNTYVIGFEDLRIGKKDLQSGKTDGDYQDMIVSVTVESAPIPNPEPGTMLLMGAGIAGAAWMRRRQLKNAT